MNKSRQHQPLRVPAGWTGQDRALVIQIEHLLDEVYSLLLRLGETEGTAFPGDRGKALEDGKADKDTTVTNVAYDGTNKKITKTIDGSTTDVVAVSTIKGDLGAFTWGQIAGQ